MDEHKKERQPPKVFLAINMFKHALHAYVHTICSLGPFHMETGLFFNGKFFNCGKMIFLSVTQTLSEKQIRVLQIGVHLLIYDHNLLVLFFSALPLFHRCVS